MRHRPSFLMSLTVAAYSALFSGCDSAGRQAAIPQQHAAPDVQATKKTRPGRSRKSTTGNANIGRQPVSSASPPTRQMTIDPINACHQLTTSRPRNVTVIVDRTRAFIQPRVLQEPLTQFPNGTILSDSRRRATGYIQFDDRRWVNPVGTLVVPMSSRLLRPRLILPTRMHLKVLGRRRGRMSPDSPSRSEAEREGCHPLRASR